MGATTEFGFPFADPESPPDLAYWTEALAQAIADHLHDTGWLPISVASGFAPMAGSEAPVARVKAGVVYIAGGWLNTGMVAGGTYVIGTLPLVDGKSIAPAQNDIRPVGSSAGAAQAHGFIQTGGEVSIRLGPTLGGYYKFSRSYPLG
jgi:hypothetical protein